MTGLPKHIQSARNLYAKELGICNICGETVPKVFWTMHMKNKHGWRDED